MSYTPGDKTMLNKKTLSAATLLTLVSTIDPVLGECIKPKGRYEKSCGRCRLYQGYTLQMIDGKQVDACKFECYSCRTSKKNHTNYRVKLFIPSNIEVSLTNCDGKLKRTSKLNGEKCPDLMVPATYHCYGGRTCKPASWKTVKA